MTMKTRSQYLMVSVALLCSYDVILGWHFSVLPNRISISSCTSNSQQSSMICCRRNALVGLVIGAASSSIASPMAAHAASVPKMSVPLETSSGTTIRIEEIGSGLDLLSPPTVSNSDVFYPSSMMNTRWRVQRAVVSVEGDIDQAALIWKLLGGSDERAFTSKFTEVYETSFVAPTYSADTTTTMKDAYYDYEEKVLKAAVLDRVTEMSSRIGIPKDVIHWNTKLNSLDYSRNNNSNNDAVNLTIVRRKNEPISDSGFGSEEVYRILSSAGGAFAGSNIYRAARVRRRYRRGYDEVSGKRILDCIEIVTTHRVLDGVAQIELPTSTCKTRMKYTQNI